MGQLRIAVFLLIILSTFNQLVLAGPTTSTPSQCSTYCIESKLIRLTPGTSYEYSYSGWAETSLAPHSPRPEDHDPSSGLLLNATVTVTALTPCEIQLDMSEVRISGSGGARHEAELSRESLRASLQAGRMETLCVPETTSALERWALNVKRGVLSALQVSLRATPEDSGTLAIHETDVSGTCRTKYQYLHLNESVLVTREKDLTLCSGRSGAGDVTKPLYLDMTKAPSSQPLLRGEQECIHTLRDGRVNIVRCRESHVFRPFSNGDNGAITRIEQVLVLENVVAGKPKKPDPLPATYRRTSLLYEHGELETTQEAAEDAMTATVALLDEMAPYGHTLSIQRDTAEKFAQLVRLMRALDHQYLMTLATGLPYSDAARELVMDALPLLDTAAATETMASLYVARSQQPPRLRHWLEHRAGSWIASLAYSRRPDTKMLQAAMVLLQEFENGNLPHIDATGVVLGVSGLAHALCERLGGVSECSQDPAVRATVLTLERVAAFEDHRARLLAIKGLGNLGVFLGAEPLLKSYYQNSSANIELRLAAMDAFRRAPCDTTTSPFLDVYTDSSEDSEARIAAYLAAVRCPTPAVLRAVKRTLYSEVVNQVGSFVWTHLTNSQESSSKARQSLRFLLGNEFLQNKFNTDARQYSRNFEASRYFESLGVGASVDANVIFSTKSYLPRSAMLNLTVDLFGETVNLLELGGRAEGLEPVIERLFARHGVLENEPLAEMLRNTRSDPTLDSARNLTSPFKQDMTPKLSTYVRLFGNEISYSELEDMLQTSQKFDVNPSYILRALISRKEHSFSRSLELIQASQETPTAIGLPLRLSLNGTASVHVAMRGNIESTKTGVEVSGKFAPSANIAVTGVMSVGNDDFTQGLKFQAMMYTHTTLDSRLKIFYDGKLNFQSEMPTEKQTLIEMKAERFIFNGDKISSLPDLTPDRETYVDCTGDFTEQLFGVKICSEISYPNATLVETAPYYPLTGDSYLNITIVKTDPTFKTYDLSTSWSYIPGLKYDFGVSYDRLGSSLENRRRVVQAVYDREAGVARLTLDLPEKQAQVAVSWDNRDLSAAELVATYDRVTVAEVFAKMAHQTKLIPGTNTIKSGKYDPQLKFKVKGLPEFAMRGVINYVADSKVSVELRLDGLTERALSLAADYTLDAMTNSVEARVSLESPWVTCDLKGGAKVTPSSLGLRVGGIYNLTRDNPHSVDLTAKYNWNTQGALSRFYLNLRAQLSQWPHLSGQIMGEMMMSRGYYELAARALLADREWNITQRAQSSGGGDIWLSNSIQCPQKGIDFRAEHRHKLKENSFSTTTRLHVDSTRQGSFHLECKRIPGDGVSFAADSSLLWPGTTFSNGAGPYFESRLQQVVPGQYVAHLTTQWSEHRKPLRINATYVNRSSLKALRHSVDMQMTGVANFTEEAPLLITGRLQAESGGAQANATLSYGTKEQARVVATYDLEMQERHRFSLTTVVANSRKYEFSAELVNTELDKVVILDVVMSRHIAFDFKLSPGMLRTSVFWDKARHPQHNVTFTVDVLHHSSGPEIRSVFMIPGQKISMDANWRNKADTASRDTETVILWGHEVLGRLSWLPDREMSVAGSFLGSLRDGVSAHAELATRGIPVLGHSLRQVKAEYMPGTPATALVTYAWGADGTTQNNVSCEVSVRRNNPRLSVHAKVMSSLWRNKEAKVQIATTFTNWSSFSGTLSGKWGAEGAAVQWGWETASLARLSVQSSWSRLPTCGAELRLNVQDDSLVSRHWAKVHHEDDRWEATLALRRHQVSKNLDSAQLDVTTPLADFKAHSINVSWIQNYPTQLEVQVRLVTPLVGDYTLTGYYGLDAELNAGLHVLTADTTLLKLDLSMKKESRTFNSALLTILIPEICHVETWGYFKKNFSGFDMQFKFMNHRKLLHQFELTAHHEKYQDESVACRASFTGFSYLILTSKWEIIMTHAGSINKHTSYIRVNEFILDHKFTYNDFGDWNFRLLGKTNTDLINATLLHVDNSSMFYYLNVMDTDVMNFIGDIEQGYVNLNFLNNAFQIHTKFEYVDELITYTKIIADMSLIASVSTNSFLRYNENDKIESMIIGGTVQSGSDSLSLKINMDRGRQLIGSFVLNFGELQIDVGLDVLSANNSVHIIYSREGTRSMSLETFVNIEGTFGTFGIAGSYLEHYVRIDGDVQIDQKYVSVTAVLDSNYDPRALPITLKGKLLLHELRLDATLVDKTGLGLSIVGKVNLRENSKSLMFGVNFIGPKEYAHEYEDEYLNLDIKYETISGHVLVITYEKKRFKYHGEFALTEKLIEARVMTPLKGYKQVSFRLGIAEDEPQRTVLEFSKEDYSFNSEIMFKTGDNAQTVVVAKSSSGLELEAVFTKLRRQRSTDCLLVVQLNGEKIEAGALLQFSEGNLNITTNVTRNGETSRLTADIHRTERSKSFAITSVFLRQVYRLHIYSAALEVLSADLLYEQGFKVHTPSFNSEFKYEKNSARSLAYLKFQRQVIQCTMDGNIKKGELEISHMADKSLSNLRLVFDFEDKIDATLTTLLNEPLRHSNVPLTLAYAQPLYIRAMYNADLGKAHFSLKSKNISYLADGTYVNNAEGSKVDLALETPFFEKICFNTSFKFIGNKKLMALHFDYGADFYDIFSEVSLDGTYSVQLNLDIKSSLQNFERIHVQGGFKNDVNFEASMKLDFPSEFYVVTISVIPDQKLVAKIQTSNREFQFGYENLIEQHTVSLKIDQREIINAEFKTVDNVLQGRLVTPYNKYRNVTVYVGFGNNLPSKSIVIHRNDELVFKAHMYPVDEEEMQSGTGIMATFYQGDEKLVYDAQFSVNNPVYVILKQHETVNGTRDILHFSLNVTDENTATGEAVVLLPIAPHTKILAKGYIQIENNNAEFKVSYKIDGEQESDFFITYQSFTDDYSKYNIITNISTPFKGYDNMLLKMQSSVSETTVNFVSPFIGYENISILSVHRLAGNKKELQVKYQNKEKRIFYMKALFYNEPDNKLVDLEARSPFLNGQVLVRSNGTLMGVKIEHEHIILLEILSQYHQLKYGQEYTFLFTKPNKIFELSTYFNRHSNTEFRFSTTMDGKKLTNIDFLMSESGQITAELLCPNQKYYTISGVVDGSENLLKLSVTSENFVTEMDVAIKSTGYVNVDSSLLENPFSMLWDISKCGTSFNMSTGPSLAVTYFLTNASVNLNVTMNNRVYSVLFGRTQTKGWPNLKVNLIWDSQPIIDFQHQYQTDHQITNIRTRLISPYLGTHKNMKFDVKLKTKDIISVEAEFKWRPKDLTVFKSQLKLSTLSSHAIISFRSPFSSDFEFNANYEFATDVRSMEVFYKLLETVHLKVTIIPTGNEQKLNVTLNSPVRGYKHVSFIGLYTYNRKKHDATLTFKRENSESEIHVSVNGGELKATMTTSMSRWILTANYDLNGGTHSVTGAFQWGTVSDVVKAEFMYKHASKLYLNIDAPYNNYKIDYKTEWTDKKKVVDLLLKRDEITAEFNFQFNIRDNLYMLVAFTKAPFMEFIRVSSILDLESEELRGALQVNETVYSLQASRLDDSKFEAALLTDEIERVKFDVSYDGDIERGLKVNVICTTPEQARVKLEGMLTISKTQKSASFDAYWGSDLLQNWYFTIDIDEDDYPGIQTKINTKTLPDFEAYVNFGSNFVSFIVRNQSETLKTRVNYLFHDVYTLNTTINYNENVYKALTYFDPNEMTASFDVSWPNNQKVLFAIILRPGELFLNIGTPCAHFSNIQISGKYTENHSSSKYELTSSAQAKWDEYAVFLAGSVRNLKDNYGLTGTFMWGDNDTISLSCDVLNNKTLIFDLTTPFKGLPHIFAKLEALKYRHIVTGLRGELETPFMKLPQVNFTFNRLENSLIEAQFSFNTATYKNISIYTKFSTTNNNQLYLHINTPFMNQVKQIKIDAKSIKMQREGTNTKVLIYIDNNLYEMRNNYSLIQGKLDSSVYLKGPNSAPIEFKFGGKFVMNSFSDIDLESYFNEDIVSLKYELSQNAVILGKIFIPSAQIWDVPTDFSLNIIRNGYFDGKLNYNYGGIVGNALIKNKLTDTALETVMYLNLPSVLKYPLQLELNANYIHPRLQFTGYASFMAEHRLELTMAQNSFRTTLDAHLNSAFFTGTRKFSLSLTSDTLSVSMNDEIRVTGLKKPNQLVLTLSQLLKKQDHTLTYNWELLRIPKFEVTLVSPILTAKKASFSATYLGLTQGVNLKLTSGKESMRLDYGLINQHTSKGIKIVIGNENTQMLNFAATLVKITNGHEVIADLQVIDINYKAQFNYTLPMDEPVLTAAVKLETPYFFPMKLLKADLKAGRQSSKYVLSAGVQFDEETLQLRSVLENESLVIELNSSFQYMASGKLLANYKSIDDKSIIEARLIANDVELISSNSTLIRRPHSVILECYSKASFEGFEEFRLKLTIPTELKYSLTANVELLSKESFKAYFILTSRPEYTNLDLVMTGLSANIHLTSNQGDFSYKSGTDDYHMRIYSKSSGHELHSELTVNSGTIELFKAGLFGMYHNHTDFYILMSTTSVYEPVQNVVFYVGAEKSQLRFGAEYEGTMEPSKQSYTATINHHLQSLTDFDLGLTLENSGKETFIAKLTHTLKSDFYVALAQINKSIIKITKINQDQVILGTGTLKHGNFSTEISGKLIVNDRSKGVDIKLTLDNIIYQIGGLYNYSDVFFKATFDIDSPYTKQNSLVLELAQPDILYVAIDHQHASLILIDLDPRKTRSKYIFVNLTDPKFMLNEVNEQNSSVQVLASLLYNQKTYQVEYDLHRDLQSPGTYKCNVTVIVPTRTVNILRDRVISNERNASSLYVSWERADTKVGYSYELFRDNFKTNVKVALEIPQRALELKTHKRYMVIDDELTDIEYGVQFNWNAKVHKTPLTAIVSVKYNSNEAYIYLVLAHPLFDRSFVIDAETRRISSWETHLASQVGTVKDGVMNHLFSTALNITGDKTTQQYRLLLLHPETSLNHLWSVKIDTARGVFTKVTLVDRTNKRHATGAVDYVTGRNRLDVSLACDELEVKLAGEVVMDRTNGRYGLLLAGSYDPLRDPLSISATFERLDSERVRVTAELLVAQERGYIGEARYSPTDISARVLHGEYSSSFTAVQASMTLNNSETLSVRGRYLPELWNNITLDLTEPYDHASLVLQQLTIRLREMLSDDVLTRLSNSSVSSTLEMVYSSVKDDTREQIGGLSHEMFALNAYVIQMYSEDNFYMRTMWDFFVGTFWQGQQMLGAGLSNVMHAIRSFYTRVLPELLITIYRSTIEPIVEGLQKIAPSIGRFMKRLSNTWKSIHEAVSSTYRTSVTYARDATVKMTKYTSENVEAMTNWVTDTKETVMNEVVSPWMSSASELASALESWIGSINDFISALPVQFEQYVLSLDEVKAVISIYKQYANWLEEIRFAELVATLRDTFRAWYAGVVNDIKEQLGEHLHHVTIALDAMKGTYDEIMTLPPVVHVRLIYARVSQKVSWIWNYNELEKTLQHIIMSISDEVLQLVIGFTDDSLEDYRKNSAFDDDSDEKKFRYDSETGEFVATVPLPFKWHRFDRAPELEAELNEKFSKFRYAVVDHMYQLATQTTDFTDAVYRTLLPPFSSSALVTVNGNVITFDGHHYKIKDPLCGTYLLAADYHDHKFFVLVNYGSQDTPGPMRSLTLFTKTGHRFDLSLDLEARERNDEDGFSRVSINSNKVELPVQSDGFTVRRDGQIVVMTGESGVLLRCNVVAGLCSLELPGWFHGRVTGFAGSLDRELGNDVMNPQEDDFQQWKVGDTNNCSAPSSKHVSKTRVRSSSVCRSLFQQTESPFQPCFKRLDPTPFRLMCDQDSAGYAPNRALPDHEQDRGPECLAAEAYVEQCKFVGMDLSMPANCVRCRLPNGRALTAGEMVIYDAAVESRLPAPPSLADVVFLMEHGTENVECLQGRDLADLPAKLDSVLRTSLGITSTRFALLSYGAGRDTDVHTQEGLIWGGRRSVQNALNSLQLEHTKERATDRDLLTSLLATVSRISFRAGASKSIILAPCHACERSEETAAVFAEASSVLLETDVRLHVLQRDEMPFRRVKKRQSVNQGNVNPVMGVDSDGAYTGRRVKGTSIPLPSKAIMRQLSIPKDLCTPLALETNGTLFSAARLLPKREDQQQTGDGKRKWLDVWSRRVASSAKPTPCQTCDCHPYTDGSSRITCQPCVSPSIQHFLQEWEDFLEAAELEDGVEDMDNDGPTDSEEVAEALSNAARVQEETEAEREVLNRLRDMLMHGKAMPKGF